jgi:hypothetical protein
MPRLNPILEYVPMKSLVLNLPVRLRPRSPRPALLWLLAGFMALALLASCGGGGVGSNGTGAVNLGMASGTVTGFGSIVVDGVHFDDSTATVKVARSAADDSAGGVKAEVKPGQQLSFSFTGTTEGKGVAQNITVLPTFIGVVSAYVPGGTSISVLGLAIKINTDPALGPVTVIDDSIDPLSPLTNGAHVEVHAIQGGNGSGGLVATRIEESLSPDELVRGIIKVLPDSTSKTATIGDLHVDLTAVAKDQPAVYKALTLGQSVTAYRTYDPANDPADPAVLFKAKRIHVDSVAVTSKVDDYLSGFITLVDLTNKTFKINGVTLVDIASADVSKTPDVGQYVRVRGVTVATSSGAVFKASSVRLRKDEISNAGGDAELIGNILNYVPEVETSTPTQPATFKVRSVSVTVPVSVVKAVDFTSCSGLTKLASGMYVQVKGNTTADGVTATSVKCDSEPTTAGTTVERVGTVEGTPPSTNTASTGTFQFAVSAQTTIKVVYDDQTFFRSSVPKDGRELSRSMPLEIEGVFSGTGVDRVLRATKIKREGH